MKWIYSAPNRAHHLAFAQGLLEHGLLHRFLWAYPRLSPRKDSGIPAPYLSRVDLWQTAFLLAARMRAPDPWLRRLDWRSKIALNRAASKHLHEADGYLFYNGTGLDSIRRFRGSGKWFACEVVNAHVQFQQEILCEEADRTGTAPPRTFPPEVDKRVAEYAESDIILCPSRFVRRTLVEKGIPESRCFLVPYGIPPFTPRQTTGSPDPSPAHRFRVLYVGQLHLRKGLPYLFEAFEQLDHPGKELVLVGADTPYNNVGKRLGQPGVHYRGVLHGDALQAEFEQADVLVLPSVEDAFGLVVAEALAYGLPVVTTDNAGAADWILPGNNGYVVPIRDPEAIHRHLQSLASEPDLLRHLKSSVRSHNNPGWHWDAAKRRLAETLLSLEKGNDHDP